MSDPIIKIAKSLTGKILAGNPYQPNSAKTVMNTINNSIYRR